MSTCLPVENAQSHVTAFQPISEAARSWSDDNKLYYDKFKFSTNNRKINKISQSYCNTQNMVAATFNDKQQIAFKISTTESFQPINSIEWV